MGRDLITIVFDLGGVLIEWNPRYLYRKLFGADEERMEKFLAEVCTKDWNHGLDCGRSFAEAVAELVARYPDQAELIRAYDLRWEEMVTGAIEPTVEILAALKRAGYPLYALSNWSTEKFINIPERFTFLRWFEKIVISGDVKCAKPDAEIYRRLLESIGKSAPECLFIDDNLPNIEAARGLGFQTIHYRSTERLRDDLKSMGILP